MARMHDVDHHYLIREALRSADLGMFVFPLWPRSKVPALHGEKHCPRRGPCAQGHRGWEAHATRDPELIRRWWQQWPLNIGVATGPSGLHVLDLDAAHGEDPPPRWAGARHGRDVLARLADQAGQPLPSDTYTVQTPSGGFHLYFRIPQVLNLRNTVARLGWRVDSRGGGGYVVAAGSLLTHGRYTVANDHSIASLPDWLIPLLRPPRLVVHPTVAWHRLGPVSEVRKDAYLTRIHDNVAATPEGYRHDTLVRAAFTLGRLAQGGDMTLEEARACLRDAVARWRGTPSSKDLNTIEDGLEAGARQPRRLAG
ncbi:bifunctional DNA primase/polymerase [Actinophytocola sp.]|uniref:bifunctional DNA primase/polymerase n=1 Tax=Actinophytocola sp. TaxID=1872138 RepID=UPI003D6B1AB1